MTSTKKPRVLKTGSDAPAPELSPKAMQVAAEAFIESATNAQQQQTVLDDTVAISAEHNRASLIGWDLAAGPDFNCMRYVLNLEDIENVAQICHEANRAYCVGLGDDSQVSWAEASDHVRQSAINGVQFLVDHPCAAQAAQHENWMAMKVDAGWIYGPEKSEDEKTHPCLVPYDQLPPDQRAKDQLFQAVARHAMGAIQTAADNLLANYLDSKGPVLMTASLNYQEGVSGWAERPPLSLTSLDDAKGLEVVPHGTGEVWEPLTERDITSFKADDGTTMRVTVLNGGRLAAEPAYPPETY